MTGFFYTAALFVLLNVAVSLVRVLKGPTRADRVMGAQLIGTGGVTILVLLYPVSDQSGILDVALLFALLAAFAAVAFVTSIGPGGADDSEAE